MSHLAAAAARVTEAARAAGIRVTEDARSLNPPTVLVTPETVTRTTRTQADVIVRAVLVAPGPANLDALRRLDDLAAAMTPALDTAGIPWTEGRVGILTSPSSGEDILAYELLMTITTGV